MRWISGARAGLALALAAFLFGAGAGEAAQSTAEASSTASPAPKALAVEQAVADGLATDPGLLSATARAAKFREADARFKMMPSLAVSAGYTQLSTEPSPSPSATGNAVVDGVVNALLADFTSTPTTEKDVRADLQYPIFSAGFRLHEAAEIAKYQALGKDAAAELNRNALAFEIRRAYWETVRAQSNVEAMRKALELESLMKKEIADLRPKAWRTRPTVWRRRSATIRLSSPSTRRSRARISPSSCSLPSSATGARVRGMGKPSTR